MVASVQVVDSIFASADDGGVLGEGPDGSERLSLVFHSLSAAQTIAFADDWTYVLGAQVLAVGRYELDVVEQAVWGGGGVETSVNHEQGGGSRHSLDPGEDLAVRNPHVDGRLQLAVDSGGHDELLLVVRGVSGGATDPSNNGAAAVPLACSLGRRDTAFNIFTINNLVVQL